MGYLALIVGVVFVTLKFAHVIAWPWVWVLAPFWVYAVIVILLLAIVGTAFGVILKAVEKKK